VCKPGCSRLQDCPNHAVFVNVAAALSLADTGAVSDALCIFEDDLSTTAWRHRDTSKFHCCRTLPILSARNLCENCLPHSTGSVCTTVPSKLRCLQPDTTLLLLQPATGSARRVQWSWWSGLWPQCPTMTTYSTSGDKRACRVEFQMNVVKPNCVTSSNSCGTASNYLLQVWPGWQHQGRPDGSRVHGDR
jgi:Copper amine oxidase, enzyme domain